MKDLSRKVAMLCPLCGNDQFGCLDEELGDSVDTPDEARFRCSDCGSVFTKEELIAENAEVLDNAVEDIKEDLLKELQKEMKSWKF